MAETGKVEDPGVEVVTDHIRPCTEKSWQKRSPSDLELKKMAVTADSLENPGRKLKFKFGYTAWFMTIKNANNKKEVHDWIRPESVEAALDSKGGDTNELAIVIGNDGPQIGSGHKVNIMIGTDAVAEKYENMLNEEVRDIEFLVVTDKAKQPASSTTAGGDQLANIYAVDIITPRTLTEHGYVVDWF